MHGLLRSFESVECVCVRVFACNKYFFEMFHFLFLNFFFVFFKNRHIARFAIHTRWMKKFILNGLLETRWLRNTNFQHKLVRKAKRSQACSILAWFFKSALAQVALWKHFALSKNKLLILHDEYSNSLLNTKFHH